VAHLNALGHYCELMGVKDVFKLPSKGTGEELDNEDEENNNIHIHACSLRDKREGDVMIFAGFLLFFFLSPKHPLI